MTIDCFRVVWCLVNAVIVNRISRQLVDIFRMSDGDSMATFLLLVVVSLGAWWGWVLWLL